MKIGDKVCHVAGRFSSHRSRGYFTSHLIGGLGEPGVVIGSFWLWVKISYIAGDTLVEQWLPKILLISREEYMAREEVC